MRKADYAALANEIRARLAGAKHCEKQTERDQANREYFRGAIDALDGLARRFAQDASVNRTEFLKACGIEP